MTTTPNADMDELHDRMPVILDERHWPVWLSETEGDHTALLARRRMVLCTCGPSIGALLAAEQLLVELGVTVRVP